MKKWKREEWYNSAEFKKLRLFGNVASEVHHKCQYLYDILEIILADKPDLIVFDRFTIVERQLRVLQANYKGDWNRISSLTGMSTDQFHQSNKKKTRLRLPKSKRPKADNDGTSLR